MFKQITAALLGLFLTGCATVNTPSLETVMRETYRVSCEQTIAQTVRTLSFEGLRVHGEYNYCKVSARDFDLQEVNAYSSNLELTRKEREVSPRK